MSNFLSHLLWLYSLVCVRSGRKPGFCSDAAHIMTRILEIRIIETGGLTAGVKNNRGDDQLHVEAAF